MDLKSLKKVQDAGFIIESVTPTHVIGRFPSGDCSLLVKFAKGDHVPDVRRENDAIRHVIKEEDDFRLLLRERREKLGLTIREVEEISGMPIDFLAKIEKDRQNEKARVPSFATRLIWAEALGYNVYLGPTDLTRLALRTICDTRDKVSSRRRRSQVEARRRDKAS